MRKVFGNKVKSLRKKKGYTQHDLAYLCGLCPINASDNPNAYVTVSRWERGKCYPNISTLVQLSQVLGASIDYLLCDDVTKLEIKSYHVPLLDDRTFQFWVNNLNTEFISYLDKNECEHINVDEEYSQKAFAIDGSLTNCEHIISDAFDDPKETYLIVEPKINKRSIKDNDFVFIS